MVAEPPRAPRQDRSRATRARLLEAAIDCLSEVGWAGSTVAVVAERAGVSRGAAQHHFPTREDLVTAAIEYVATERVTALRATLPDLPDGPGRTASVVTGIGEMYSGKMFRAAVQVWVAAAADPQLQAKVVPLEARVGREAHRLTVEALHADETRPGVREAIQATLDLARGLGLANLLTDDTKRRTRVLTEWATSLDAVIRPRTGSGRPEDLSGP